MLPPLPLPPMAVAIIRSGEDSSPTRLAAESSEAREQDQQATNEVSSNEVIPSASPPSSPQSAIDINKKRITSQYASNREYTFNHFNSQTPQVWQRKNLTLSIDSCKAGVSISDLWLFQCSVIHFIEHHKSSESEFVHNSGGRTADATVTLESVSSGRRFQYDTSF
jgi:hypothetical protein